MSSLQQHKTCLKIQASQIQRRTFNNKPILVLPVVMLKQGVFHGSSGPLYYPDDELSRTAHLWNSRPVLIDHPFGDRGSPISANNPRTWEGKVLGQIWNAKFEKGALKAEIWLDEIRTKQIAPDLLDKIMSGVSVEVSTGLFSTDEQTKGIYNGKEYRAIARDHDPDHLALLPNSRGACSWQDGCGIRSNESTFKYLQQYFEDHKGDFTMEEQPLIMPTLEVVTDKTVTYNETTINTNKVEYDMDVAKLWRKR